MEAQPSPLPPAPTEVAPLPGALAEAAPRQEGLLLVGCCVASALALSWVLQLTNGTLSTTAIRGLTVAFALLAVGVLGPRALRPRAWWEPLLVALLGGALLLQLSWLFTEHPGVYLRLSGPWPYQRFHQGLLTAALVSGALLAGPERLRRVLLPVLLGAHLLLGVWMIRSSPAPFIDVYVFQTQGVERLLQGGNPYAMTFPNIYGHTQYYGEGLVVDGQLRFGFPYPPLSLFFALLGKVLGGDPRYAQLGAMTLAAALMAWARGGRLGAAAAALYLLMPRGFFVLEQSWTEPFLVLLLAATVFCACRFPRALPYAVGLLLASKQYSLFIVPLLVLLVPLGGRQAWGLLWRAAATAAVVSLPLALLDVGAFLRSVVTLQVHQPFRMDALSYLSWWVSKGHAPPPMWIPFAAVLGALGLALWRAPRTPSGFAAAVALAYVTFFAFNKQAFCNYYYFVVGALCVAVAAARLPEASTAPARGSAT